MSNYQDILTERLQRTPLGWWDIRSKLRHFALITYAVPKERLAPHIPSSRFDIPEWDIDGTPYAFLSVVPFVDVDFHFARLAPFAKFRFAQTNHRVYVIDRHTNQHIVWFFGTTLGSRVVHLAQTAWRIPWHYARYHVDCALDETTGQYTRFQYQATCDWCETEIDITHDRQAVGIPPGFTSMDEANLVLTHPVQGFTFGVMGIWVGIASGMMSSQ